MSLDIVTAASWFRSATNGLAHLEYVSRYATRDAADEAGEESESDDEMSSAGSFNSRDDEEPAGTMEV